MSKRAGRLAEDYADAPRGLRCSPFFDDELAKQAPLPAGGVRLATFISNCGGGTRNRLIAELTKEGIIFDHYGKCKEDVFGGEKQVSLLSRSHSLGKRSD